MSLMKFYWNMLKFKKSANLKVPINISVYPLILLYMLRLGSKVYLSNNCNTSGDAHLLGIS